MQKKLFSSCSILSEAGTNRSVFDLSDTGINHEKNVRCLTNCCNVCVRCDKHSLWLINALKMKQVQKNKAKQ